MPLAVIFAVSIPLFLLVGSFAFVVWFFGPIVGRFATQFALERGRAPARSR